MYAKLGSTFYSLVYLSNFVHCISLLAVFINLSVPHANSNVAASGVPSPISYFSAKSGNRSNCRDDQFVIHQAPRPASHSKTILLMT